VPGTQARVLTLMAFHALMATTRRWADPDQLAEPRVDLGLV
jgi:hypothetical protein